MEYKVLVNGKSAFVNDFLKHTSDHFYGLSSSAYLKDVNNHFRFASPDALVSFVETAKSEVVATMRNCKDYPYFNSALTVIVGTPEVCDELQITEPYLADLFIKRPISADNLALKITRRLEQIKAESDKSDEEKEEAKKNKSDTKKHILIVDDDRSMLKMLKTALSESYEVTTMINGVLVEKFLDSKDVDLIILDYEMPIETGAEVFKKLKKHPKGKNVPVCFLTGVAERSKIEEIMALKPHGYLLKPINLELLMTSISNLTA